MTVESRKSPFTAAEERLIEEWPDVLGRMAIVSRQKPTTFFRPLRAKDLAHMKRWVDPRDDELLIPPIPIIAENGIVLTSNPVDCIRECVMDAFRLRINAGDQASENEGKAETCVYILAYLCRRRVLAWNLLKIFVPVLRRGALDAQTRGNIEFMFFEHAWEAVFDYDDLSEPQVSQFVSAPAEPFNWPGSLNSVPDDERHRMLEFASYPPLADPKRPAIAPWNERWFNLAWLWDESHGARCHALALQQWKQDTQ